MGNPLAGKGHLQHVGTTIPSVGAIAVCAQHRVSLWGAADPSHSAPQGESWKQPRARLLPPGCVNQALGMRQDTNGEML